MAVMEREGEHPTALAAIRAILLRGFRRMEVLATQRQWVRAKDHCVCFPIPRPAGRFG